MCWLVLFTVTLAPSPAESSKYRVLPWQLVQAATTYPEPKPFTSLAVDFQLPDGLPETDHYLFAVPLAARISQTGCYFGYLQSPGLHHTTADGVKHRPGPGFVFTRFGDRSAQYVRPAVGGLYFLSDHEGPLASVRRPHKLTTGRHQFRLTVTDPGTEDGRPFCWVRAAVRCPDETTLEIGSLRFDTDKPTTGGVLSAFLEFSDRPDRPPRPS